MFLGASLQIRGIFNDCELSISNFSLCCNFYHRIKLVLIHTQQLHHQQVSEYKNTCTVHIYIHSHTQCSCFDAYIYKHIHSIL